MRGNRAPSLGTGTATLSTPYGRTSQSRTRHAVEYFGSSSRFGGYRAIHSRGGVVRWDRAWRCRAGRRVSYNESCLTLLCTTSLFSSVKQALLTTPHSLDLNTQVPYSGDGNFRHSDGYIYSYDCHAPVTNPCKLARVPAASATDRSQWRFYTSQGQWSTNYSSAAGLLRSGPGGMSVFYNSYLGRFVAVYQGHPGEDFNRHKIVFRVANQPWGPWSSEGRLPMTQMLPCSGCGFGNYATPAHPEFQQGSGKTIFLTYVRPTGGFSQETRIVKVVFN